MKLKLVSPPLLFSQPTKVIVRVLTGAAILLSSAAIQGQQKTHLRFERISTEQGLSQCSIQCVFQDSRGFMWFGTQDGLNRFDGHTFTVYRHSPNDLDSLSDNIVLAIGEDSNGSLWAGTLGGGLDRFDPRTESFTNFRHDAQDPASLSHDQVRAIHEDSGPTLWVGTAAGLNRFDSVTRSFVRFRHDDHDPSSLANDAVTAILEDSGGTLWVGTSGGLDRFDPDTGTFIHVRPDGQDSSARGNNLILAIFEDSSGSLWIGSRGGLSRFDPGTETFTDFRHDARDATSLSDNVVRAIGEDSRGRLWVGTWGGGLNRLDPESGRFLRFKHDANDPRSLGHNNVNSIYSDSGGLLWVGTLGAGLSRLNPQTEFFAHFRHDAEDPTSLSHDNVLAICEDSRGRLWVGTLGGVLDRRNPETGGFVHFRHDADNPTGLSSDDVKAIFEDSSGTLWVGTGAGGLNRFDPEREAFSHFMSDAEDPSALSQNYIKAIYEDSGGTLWVGTAGGGLNRFDSQTETFTQFRIDQQDPTSLSQDYVLAIAEDSSGPLWVGTMEAGLNRFDRQTETFSRFRHDPLDASSLSNDRVTCLTRTADGTIWIGTSGGGFNRLIAGRDQRVQFERFTTQDGLAADAIGGILEDDRGHLWLSTTQGISTFDPKNRTFKNYGDRDGVQGSGYWIGSSFKDRLGNLYFGGTKGLTWFHPHNIKDDVRPPQIVLTRFLLFNREVRVGEEGSPLFSPIDYCQEIVLSHTQYLFSVEFAASHYAQPEKNHYAFKLEGIDEEWVLTDAENRRATYTTLPAGRYTFRVKASNKDGYWNEEGRALKIRVLPPPWKTWWAFSLYGAAVLTLVLWFVQSKRREVIEKQIELEREQQVSAQLKRVDKLKDQFLANMSHEFRTPLNAIIGFSAVLKTRLAPQIDPKLSKLLDRIHSSGKHLLTIICDMMDISLLASGELVLETRPTAVAAVMEAVLEALRPRIGEREIELVNGLPSELPLVQADEQRLGQILTKLVGNAIKFTESGRVEVRGEVIVDVFDRTPSESGQALAITVLDAGIGIPQEDHEAIFQSFEQVDGTMSRQFDGAGLGLSITRQLVELHGGGMFVESEIGVGSRFTFTLTLSRAPHRDSNTSSKPRG